jgi:hypothetical protein
MASIYELKNEFNTLWMILEDELVDDEALVGAWETATEDLSIKLENCCKYIKNEEAVIAGLKEEEERLNARRKAKENAIKRLKALMQDAMNAAGEKKIQCGTFTTSIQNTAPSVVVDEQYIENIPAEYLRVKEPEIDKKKLLEDLKSGKDLEGLAHLEVKQSLRIR